jgi:hypothetical protein
MVFKPPIITVRIVAMVSFKANTLMINGSNVALMHKIVDVVEGPNGVLVLLDYSVGLNRNVFFVAPDGRVKWQIELFSDHPKAGAIPYTGVGFRENRLSAYNFAGFDCELDPETGAITKATFTK